MADDGEEGNNRRGGKSAFDDRALRAELDKGLKECESFLKISDDSRSMLLFGILAQCKK